MAMATEGSRGRVADINVTPMIDILLVLLIIFMVIVPRMPNGLAAAIPQPAKKSAVHPDPNLAVVVQVLSRAGQSPMYQINGDKVAYQDLLPRLTEIFANRAQRVMFVKGDGNVGFQSIASVIDIGKAANVDRIGLITPGMQLAQ
ncbi:MAG TPA: biopolymer transporter ExbD [Terracidiphilus sp.]|nr:biopolymer transporter ExbD [Terracidiphilus sp.]